MGAKGFRKVPEKIRATIDTLNTDLFQVGAIRRFESAGEAAVKLAHLGVTVGDDLDVPRGVVPPIRRGRWSRWNVEGRVVPRKDLPKVMKDFGWWAPNFGDSSKGEHWVSQVREVWQRETIYGQNHALLGAHKAVDAQRIDVAYRVDAVFDRRTCSDRDLVFALSLLQENFGAVGVVTTNVTQEEWLGQVRIDWEILPVGHWGPRDVAQVMRRLNLSEDGGRAAQIRERLSTIMSLRPNAVLEGTSGFARYLGYRFRDDLVAFENLDYGNALYLMFEDWAELSRRTRTELLQTGGADFVRIVHRDGWGRRLTATLQAHGHLGSRAGDGE